MYNPQLKTFVNVAEAGSFSKAAQNAYITPTAVIKQMNLLENHLGVTLFHRSHQGLSLTKAGESLLKDAQHIIQYSEESIARARMAERAEKRVIRVGISLMTPATPITGLWQHVKADYPDISMQVVSFENGPAAAQSLADLGQNIDVVLGVFDENFLAEHHCQGLELSRQPLWCAVPDGSDLAQAYTLTLEALRNHSLMMIRRGWNAGIDQLRDTIQANYPDIEILDFPQYLAEVFNRAENEGNALVTLPIWSEVHPLLKTIPTDWGYSVSYGLLYSQEPTDYVREFVDAVGKYAQKTAQSDAE